MSLTRVLTGVCLLAAVLAPASCRHQDNLAPAPVSNRTFRDHTFSESTNLSGTILMAGECIVGRGSTLTVLPGTRILFIPEDSDGDGLGDARLRIEGRLQALGDRDRPVLFSSAGTAGGARGPGDWDSLLINFSHGNEIRNTIIEYSNYSIHAHFSDGKISQSLIRRNNEGCRMGNSRFIIENSVFRDNINKGLNFRGCSNVVRGNEITGNGNGIFIFEKDMGTVITGNNIHDNERFNVRLGDFFTGTMNFDGNWWGVRAGERIRETIYDSRHDGNIGTVNIRPSDSAHRLPPVPRYPETENRAVGPPG